MDYQASQDSQDNGEPLDNKDLQAHQEIREKWDPQVYRVWLVPQEILVTPAKKGNADPREREAPKDHQEHQV